MNRNNVIDFVERLRTKPEHVRRRIAVGTTVGVTGVIAAAWLVAVLFSGTLELTPTNSSTATLATAPGSNQVVAAAGQTQSAFSQLMGAVGLANPNNTPATLTAVNPTPSTTPATDTTDDQSATGGNQTVIPF